MESQNKCTMKHSIYEDCEVCGESAWDIAVHRVKELEAKLEKMQDLDSVVTAHWEVLPLDFQLIYGANKEALEDTP